MAQARLTWLADVLRADGVPVIEHAGWKSRSRPTGNFAPRAVLWHWDASGKGDTPHEIDLVINGYAELKGPLYQCWVCRGCAPRGGSDAHESGTWHIAAAGRCSHAGTGRGWGVIRANSGNADAIGVSLDWTVDEPQDAKQIQSIRVGTAAIMRHAGWNPADALTDHASYTPGRKIDVSIGSTGLDMDAERHTVARLIARTPFVLGRGDSGPAVRDLQAKLTAHGYPLVIDGDFGPATDAALRKFQAANDLPVDGLAGQATMTALSSTPALNLLERLMSLNAAELDQLATAVAAAILNSPSGDTTVADQIKRTAENSIRAGYRDVLRARLDVAIAMGDTTAIMTALAALEATVFTGEGSVIGLPVLRKQS